MLERRNGAAYGGNQIQRIMLCASHSPVLDYADESREPVQRILAAFDDVQERIRRFDPDLIVMFGVDHYGGHSMNCMPSFTIGVENVAAIADVGGRPGPLKVPKELAVDAVYYVRNGGVDVAVSYSMDVDHAFSQLLGRAAGGVDLYPILPIFVSCIQIPFTPFARARALGEVIGNFIDEKHSDKRVLYMGTGGLSHDPAMLFPPIDSVGEEWKPYHLHGKAQRIVPQQRWIAYQIEAHKVGAQIMHEAPHDPAQFGVNPDILVGESYRQMT